MLVHGVHCMCVLHGSDLATRETTGTCAVGLVRRLTRLRPPTRTRAHIMTIFRRHFTLRVLARVSTSGALCFVLQSCPPDIPYATGGGYVVSWEPLRLIASNADMYSKYASEDVSMGLWLAPFAMNRVHDRRFDAGWRRRGCVDDRYVASRFRWLWRGGTVLTIATPVVRTARTTPAWSHTL